MDERLLGGSGVAITRGEVEEVLPRALRPALAERGELGSAGPPARAATQLDDLALLPARGAGRRGSPRSAGWRRRSTSGGRPAPARPSRRAPAPTSGASSARSRPRCRRAADAQVQPPLGDPRRARAKASPHVAGARQSSSVPPRTAAHSTGVDRVGPAASRSCAAGRAACSTRSGRRRASARGRRGPSSTRSARPSGRARRRTSAAAGPGPRAASTRRAARSRGEEDLGLLAHDDQRALRRPTSGSRRMAYRKAPRSSSSDRRAGAGWRSWSGGTAPAPAAASPRSTAAASCTCGGRGRPRPTPARPPGAGRRGRGARARDAEAGTAIPWFYQRS